MAWLEQNKVSVSALARAVGVSAVCATHWAYGRNVPGLVNAYKVERVTQGGVPVSSWLGTDVARNEWNESPLGSLDDYITDRTLAERSSSNKQALISAEDARRRAEKNGS